MNSSNTAEYWILTSNDYEVKTPVVTEIVGESKTDEHSTNQPPGPLVEVFTTTVSNVSEWLVARTITEAIIMYYVGVENRYSKKGGGRVVHRWQLQIWNCHRSPQFEILLVVCLKTQIVCT